MIQKTLPHIVYWEYGQEQETSYNLQIIFWGTWHEFGCN